MISARERLLKTEAVVLKKRQLLEKDVLVTLFTREYGKITVIAKGVRKITSKRASHIQTANLIHSELYRRGDTIYLQNTAVISAFSQLKKDIKKVNYAYRFLFVADRLLAEHQAEPVMYRLVKTFLVDISKHSFEDQNFHSYLKETLKIFGYGEQVTDTLSLIRYIEEIIQERIPTNVII